MKLTGTIRDVSTLSEQEQEKMLLLMRSHYANVRHEKFFTDIAEKDGVLLLHDKTGVIQGFTTFLLMEFAFRNQMVYALYSGDTIVDRSCWGQMQLFRCFGGLFKKFLQDQKEPLYWFLLTKGIKTYLLLPLFFRQFYPNCRTETPVEARELMEALAYRKFGTFYHKEQGIVRIVPRADSLQEQFAGIPEHKRQNAHVRYFASHNPGYTEGDELVCLARISASNFTARAQRFVKLEQFSREEREDTRSHKDKE